MFFLSHPVFGLGYQPVQYKAPIELGNLFHKTMEFNYNSGQPALNVARGAAERIMHRELFPDDKGPAEYQQFYSEWAETMALHAAMYRGYELWQENTDDYYGDKNLRYLPGMAEYSWRLEFNGIAVEGRFDHLVQHTPTGEYWIVDHKTTSNPRNLITGLSHAWQPRIYTWAARRLWPDRNIEGILYNVVTSTDPWAVKILKSGKPSKAKIELERTTYEIYLDILKMCAVDLDITEQTLLDEYAEQLDVLSAQEYPLYMRHPHRVHINEDMLEAQLMMLFQRIGNTAALLSVAKDPTIIPPALSGAVPQRFGGACQSCPYAGVCYLMDQPGADWQMVLDSSYIKDD
jgi:hypothetical protein